MQYLSDRADAPRPTVHAIELTFPQTRAQLVDTFRAGLRALKAAHAGTPFTDVPPLSPGRSADPAARRNKVVAVVDSIVSNPGVLLPWQDMVRICREEGVWSVVDAAHSIGQEVCALRLRLGFQGAEWESRARGGVDPRSCIATA